MKSKLIVANWKMNPASSSEAVSLFSSIGDQAETSADVSVAVCAPFLYLPALSRARGQYPKVEIGAQDIFWEKSGAYTGEVSGAMLSEFNVRYVIIGHSERRHYAGESDEMVGRKIGAALNSELTPIVCVGEWSREGKSWEEIELFVRKQLDIALSGLADIKERVEQHGLVIAYEPVWAISTNGGGPDVPENSVKMIALIREYAAKKLSFLGGDKLRVIYGGSLNPENAESFLDNNEVEGGLIGGASLKAESFGKIIEIAAKCSI